MAKHDRVLQELYKYIGIWDIVYIINDYSIDCPNCGTSFITNKFCTRFCSLFEHEDGLDWLLREKANFHFRLFNIIKRIDKQSEWIVIDGLNKSLFEIFPNCSWLKRENGQVLIKVTGYINEVGPWNQIVLTFDYDEYHLKKRKLIGWHRITATEDGKISDEDE